MLSPLARRSRVAARMLQTAQHSNTTITTHVTTAHTHSASAFPSSCSSSSSSSSSSPPSVPTRRFSALSLDTVNPRVISAQYAVRGELVKRADAIKDEIEAATKACKPSPFPFTSVIQCNIGNPQELGQKPLTFHRQVLSLSHFPHAIDASSPLYAPDALQRAKGYVSAIKSTGAYTTSQGIRAVRDEVAAFIAQRDGHPSNPDHIFLTDGASTAVKHILTLLLRSSSDAVLTPIPQYPLYSATLSILGGTGVGYYLDEDSVWSLKVSELHRALQQARQEGNDVRALVVINPGNPTGQVLEEEVMRDVIRFCAEEGIVLMADEVYQENVYVSNRRFISFKRLVSEMAADVQLVSFHSTSKGFIGECGQRGGYMELVNIPDSVLQQCIKLASISLCANTSGQLMTGLMVNPPSPSSPSYSLYVKERDDILSSLRRRAVVVAKALNSCRNITCQPVQGAMYAFPRIHLPAKAVDAAKRNDKAADTFYCLEMLEKTGLVTVPGSGFGQRDGEWHFRMTILPREEHLQDVLERLKQFNDNFMQKYS